MPADLNARKRGNALFLILIAIFLLAGLTVLLSRTSGTTEETGNTERTTLAVSEMMRYAQSLEDAVQRLVANGCSESQISFQNDVVAGYDNPDAPEDHSCDVFNPAGAGMIWKTPPASLTADPYFIGYNRVGTNNISTMNVGTPLPEITLVLPNITIEACDDVNRMTNQVEARESYGDNNGNANYYLKHPQSIDSSTNLTINKAELYPVPKTGCFCDLANIQNNPCAPYPNLPRSFYHTLLAR